MRNLHLNVYRSRNLRKVFAWDHSYLIQVVQSVLPNIIHMFSCVKFKAQKKIVDSILGANADECVYIFPK